MTFILRVSRINKRIKVIEKGFMGTKGYSRNSLKGGIMEKICSAFTRDTLRKVFSAARKNPFCALVFMVWILVMPCHPSAIADLLDISTVEEILVTQYPVVDYEFDYAAPRFAWTDQMDGKLWIGNVDLQTGDFLPPDGKAILVDTDTVFHGNGPEWAASLGGPRLVYTKSLPTGVLSLAQANLVDGQWIGNFLSNGEYRINPLASLNPADRMPFILYLLSVGTDKQILAWRVIDQPQSERPIPMSADATGGRWVPNMRSVVFTAPLGTWGRQAFIYDCSTRLIEQLTFDSGRKQTIFMWQAPEFNYEYIFFVSVKFTDYSAIRVYRKLDMNQDGTAEWTVIKTIVPPEKGMYFWSPELFVHNGKSYIFWVASRDSNHKNYEIPTQVWLSDINGSFLWNLTTVPNKLRIDPEVFVTEQGPFIYFNRYIPGPDTDPLTNVGFEGVYRVDTGLGPVSAP